MSSGFNIAKDFKNCEFIRNIADSIDKDKKDGNSNGYIDTKKEQSIFSLQIQLGLQSGDITEDDMVECFGIVFARSKYPAKTDNMQNADVEKQVENQSAQRTETNVPKKVTKKKVAKPQVKAQVVTQPKADTTPKTPQNKKYRIPTADSIPFEQISLKGIRPNNKQKIEGIKSITKRYDGDKLIDTIYYYENGKIVREHVERPGRGIIRDLIKKENNYVSIIPEMVDNEIVKPIKIKLPQKYNKSEAEISGDLRILGGQPDVHRKKQNNAKLFAKTLEDNKANVMKDLKLDNFTYDRFARLSLGIAERETQFGAGCVDHSWYTTGNLVYNLQKLIDIRMVSNMRNKKANTTLPSLKGRATKENDAISCGMTQIKYDNIINSANNPQDKYHEINKQIVSLFKKYNINSASDLFKADKCAIATMICIKYQIDKLQIDLTEEHKNRKEGSQPYYDIDARVQSSKDYTINRKIYKLDLEDVILNRWHAAGSALQDGSFNPAKETDNYTLDAKNFAKSVCIK